MKYLITGATGFVGKALFYKLKELEIPFDFVTRSDIPGCSEQKNKIIVDDISGNTDWANFPVGVTTVIHLAARAHILNDQTKSPIDQYRKVNTLGTLTLAKAAALRGVARFVFLSSIKVQGENTNGHGSCFSGSDGVSKPSDPYGLSKYEAELGLKKIAEDTGMEVVIIRPPLVYGPGVKANFLNLMKLLDSGVPLPFGSIANKRSFISITNLVDFVLMAASHPKAANQTFTVSDNEDMSTSQLLYRLKKALSSHSWIIPLPQPILKFFLLTLGKKRLYPRLCGSLQVDCSSAAKLLEWTPPQSVDDALQEVAEAYLLEKNI